MKMTIGRNMPGMNRKMAIGPDPQPSWKLGQMGINLPTASMGKVTKSANTSSGSAAMASAKRGPSIGIVGGGSGAPMKRKMGMSRRMGRGL